MAARVAGARPVADVVRPPADLLSPCMRLPRGPLPDRSAKLARQLARVDRAVGSDPAPLVELLNQVALVFAEAGEPDRARHVCLAQLDLCAEHHARTADPRTIVVALQPWVNLGRLRALTGDWAGALPHFGIAAAMTDGTPLRLGPLHIDPSAWSLVINTVPDAAAVATSLEIADVTKALLRAGRAELLRPWLTRWLANPDARTRPILLEARIVYGLFLRRWTDAGRLAAAGRARADATPFLRLVFGYHELLADAGAEAHAVDGLIERGRRLADAVAGLVGAAATTPYDGARLTAELADLLGRLGADRDAATLLDAAAGMAAAEPDEPLHARLLLRLRAAEPADGRADDALRELCGRSEYAEVRRRSHGPSGCRVDHGPPSFLDELDARLRDMPARR